MHDPTHTIKPQQQLDIELEPDLTFIRRLVRIVARETKQLWSKAVRLVKVQWSEDERDCTWETESSIQESNPELF